MTEVTIDDGDDGFSELEDYQAVIEQKIRERDGV